MNQNAAPNNSSERVCKEGYTKSELDCAIDFAKFLYDLWRKSQNDEIMKVDKTIYDNEEPTTN